LIRELQRRALLLQRNEEDDGEDEEDGEVGEDEQNHED
jgi:hypothetical protein